MSTPMITAEAISLNGQLKIRLIAEKDGEVVDLDELNVGRAQARAGYVKRLAPILECEPDDLEKGLVSRIRGLVPAREAARVRDIEPLPQL